jgi:hypothetical protein
MSAPSPPPARPLAWAWAWAWRAEGSGFATQSPHAYIPSSFVSHSSSLPPHIQLLSGSSRPSSRAHWIGSPKRLPSSSSPARVKDGNHVFGECHWWHDYSLSSTSWRIAGDRHGFSSTLHRAGQLHRQALCLRVHPALPLGMSLERNS